MRAIELVRLMDTINPPAMILRDSLADVEEGKDATVTWDRDHLVERLRDVADRIAREV